MTESTFTTLAALLGVAALGGVLATALRQPLIVAFIAVGVLAGPSFLNLSAGLDLELFAHLGIAVLLFVVGLKLDLHIVRTMGPVALLTGLGQVVFTSVFGFLLALALGLAPIAALYVAVALTFSSTIIIVKLLSDKRELETLHGRVAVGFLIVQDIVVVLAMIALTAAGQAQGGLGAEFLGVLLRGVALLGALGLLMRFVLPPLTAFLARSTELLMLFAIAWAVAGAAAGEWLGFSQEVGAFLAGVSLAGTPYRELIGARLVSLRDFLLLFFFVSLGAGLSLGDLGGQLWPALLLSLFVLVGNPLIVMVLMGYLGYRARTGFLAGLTVAQISEFSLILAALGFSLGLIDASTVGLITLVGLITISASTYLILYSHPLYERLAPLLRPFERRVPHREAGEAGPEEHPEVLVLGLGRFGLTIAQELMARGVRVLAADHNPELVHERAGHGIPTRYGDIEDPEFLAGLPLESARWVVGSTRDRQVNATLLRALPEAGYRGRVAVAASYPEDAAALRRLGADLVLVPYRQAGVDAVGQLLGADTERVAPVG